MKEKSYIGLFAIISPENSITALKYRGDSYELIRLNGKWMDRMFIVSESEREKTLGGSVPVVDDFIEVFDKAQNTGKKLVEDDANAYLRDMEF